MCFIKLILKCSTVRIPDDVGEIICILSSAMEYNNRELLDTAGGDEGVEGTTKRAFA